MRYDAQHKARSRASILEAARSLFRRHGFDGASIDQVMKQAGLTRGAFYAHFASKDALVAEVLAIEAGLVRALRDAADSARPRAAAREALAHYLDPAERDDVARGCPLVAHPVDAIRGDVSMRAGYGARFSSLVDAIEAASTGDRDDAIVSAVLAVGAGLFSAAVDDPELADRIAAVCLERLP